MRQLSKLGTHISNKIGKAIADYNLIEDGDRIIVAVSGGKDSMSLLKILDARRAWAPVNYELMAAHVETDYRCRGCVHTAVLRKYFDRLGVKYNFEKISIMGENARTEKRRVSCFWCSWNRRKALFLLADKLGYNKIALGHHKDDIIETILLNLFYQGQISAMNPRQEMFKGALTIIRPLCYVEEDDLRRYARECGFPRQLCACPNSLISKRRKMKGLIGSIEKGCPNVKTNIFRSVARINRDYIDLKPEEAGYGCAGGDQGQI